MPLALVLGHEPRRSQKYSHVQIVPARMHHADILMLGVLRPHLARIRQPCSLGDGQRIHVRAYQHRRPSTVLQHPHDAERPYPIFIHANVVRNLIAKPTQLPGQKRRGLLLMPRQLRRLVKRKIRRLQLRKLLADLRMQLRGLDLGQQRRRA